MATVIPMATMPPAGTVFATVVDVWLLTAACPSVSPRIEAIICGQYVKKAKPLYVEGYLKTHGWETPEGIKKERTEVIIDEIVLLGAKDTPAAPSADEEYEGSR